MKRYRPVYVCVDMQYYFLTRFGKGSNPSLEDLLAANEKQIIAHRDAGNPILLVEFKQATYKDEDQAIHKRLLDLVRDYDRWQKVPKAGPDGSHEILLTCEQFCYPQYHFILGGVFTEACIAATATGLAKRRKDSKIEIIRAACGPTYPEEVTESHLRMLAKTANIELVPPLPGTEKPQEEDVFTKARSVLAEAHAFLNHTRSAT